MTALSILAVIALIIAVALLRSEADHWASWYGECERYEEGE